MWVLLISLYVNEPLGQTQSKGVLQAPQNSYEQCQKERDRVQQYWHIDGYKVSPRCVYIKHYDSRHNGSYTPR